MTEHPCKGMTPAQRRDFERIAIGQPPLGGYRTIEKLKARGLVEDGPTVVVGRDRFGPVTRPSWYVPLPFHARWCRWCSEQPENRDA